jgi:MFS family permease
MSANTLRALRYSDFRLLWFGLGASAIGTWMQIVAQSLLVLEITHGSSLALGSVSLAQASSFLIFAFVGGSVADRIDKRRLLLTTQSISASLALILGALTRSGHIEFWMIVVIAFLNGTVLSFDHPARGALLPALVKEEDMMNAISLQSAVFNGAAAVGPVLGGVAVKVWGYPCNFFLNGASYIGVLIALFAMGAPDQAIHRQPIIKAAWDSLGTVVRDSVLPWVIAGYGALLCLGPSPALILPLFSTQILHVGPERLGLLFSSVGVGSVLGAIIGASFVAPRKSYVFFGGLFLWVFAFTEFALSRWFWLSAAMLILVGLGQMLVAITTITLLQSRVPKQMRGRVMSLNTVLVLGFRPLGDFPAGALIGVIGAPATTLLSAALVGMYSVAIALRRPSLRAV